ncbi:hypothetical protein WK41_33215 [Burkholderia cepacia]|nr:hypothetical protein WK41_33215 [Burkholderia cepacia]
MHVSVSVSVSASVSASASASASASSTRMRVTRHPAPARRTVHHDDAARLADATQNRRNARPARHRAAIALMMGALNFVPELPS